MPTAKNPPPKQHDKVYVDFTSVYRDRYGVSHMWLERQLKENPKFPRPYRFGRMRFFKIAELEAYEKKCVMAA
jgi:hypothetical protein